VALGSPLKGGNPLIFLFSFKMPRLLLYPSFTVFVLYFHLSPIGFILCVPIFHLYSSGCLFRGLPQEYFISLRYSDHAGHGIALSSLSGIAGGLRNIIMIHLLMKRRHGLTLFPQLSSLGISGKIYGMILHGRMNGKNCWAMPLPFSRIISLSYRSYIKTK
jgi:hypothetical protein